MDSDPMQLDVEVSSQFLGHLDAMAKESGEDRSEVLRIALGLLRIAREAKAEGKGLAIVTLAGEIDQEIIGF